MLQRINHEQRLYVIQAGAGFTCLGFEVCQRWTLDIAAWLRNVYPDAFGALTDFELSRDSTPGTEKAYALYERLCQLGGDAYMLTGQRCPAQLTEQLVGLEGTRVEVVDTDGEKRRFWVGKSTGWMPVHLEISRRNSSGGPAVYGAPFQAVRVVPASRRGS